MNTIEKGTKYEFFIKNYLNNNESWLQKDILKKHFFNFLKIFFENNNILKKYIL